jgi:hypothetical protein
MTGSIDEYNIKSSSKPRWRYRIYAGKNEAGEKQYVGQAGFDKQADAAEVMRQHIEELRRRVVQVPIAIETFGTNLQSATGEKF